MVINDHISAGDGKTKSDGDISNNQDWATNKNGSLNQKLVLMMVNHPPSRTCGSVFVQPRLSLRTPGMTVDFPSKKM